MKAKLLVDSVIPVENGTYAVFEGETVEVGQKLKAAHPEVEVEPMYECSYKGNTCYFYEKDLELIEEQ